jgi:hypothetical protein
MKFRNLSRWSEDSKLNGLKFFAQRLDELLFDYTLDSYKPSALNAPYLVKEALALVSDISANLLDYANLSHVLEELVWSVQNDKVAKSLLDADIEYYTSIASETEISSLKLRLEVLGRTINPTRYADAVIAELLVKIVAGEKQSIDTLTRTLATTLINSGVSKQYLYNKVLETYFHDGDTIQDVVIAGKFFDSIAPKLHRFDVILLASDAIQPVSESVKAFRLAMPDDIPESAKSVATTNSFEPRPGELYVLCTDVQAHDPYSARQRAIRSLDNLGNLLALFQHRSRITWRQDAIVIQKCCSNAVYWVTPPRGPMEKANDLRPEKAAKELNSLIRSFSAKGISFRKFNRVADIHEICINHNVADNQLVNIWTALETLTPSHSGSSKIANVTSAALPFLMHGYIRDIVQQLSYDLLNWDKWRSRKILHKVPCDPKTPLLGKTLRLLCLAENDDLRKQLYEHLKDFHLLRYRVFRLSESLSDRTKLRDMLSQHEKRVTWQIRRMYRTRNMIVHSGRVPPPYIDTLVENGHAYLDAIIIEIMRISCGPYAAETLEQVFDIAKIRYVHFAKLITGETPLTSDNCGFLLGSKYHLSSE